MTLMEMGSYFQGPSGELLKKVIDSSFSSTGEPCRKYGDSPYIPSPTCTARTTSISTGWCVCYK